jgi:plasmid stabilization system protein ParE
MSRTRITPLADQDLVEIWYFIAQDDPVAADRLIDILEEKISSSPTTRTWGRRGRILPRNCVVTR